MGSLIWVAVLFHVFVVVLIKAPLPYVAVVTKGFFRWPLAANEVHSYEKWGKYEPAMRDGR